MAIEFEYMEDVDLGFIPLFLSESNPMSASEQINASYAHGGGWRSFGTGKWVFNPVDESLTYPEDDEPLYPVAKAKLHDETIYVYDHAWVLVLQPDGSFDVARID